MGCILCHELYMGECYVLHDECGCDGPPDDCEHLLTQIEGKLGINITAGELERHLDHAKPPVTMR